MVGLFCRAARRIVDFEQGMGIGGFVLHSRICGGFGQIVAGLSGWDRVAQGGGVGWECWPTGEGGRGRVWMVVVVIAHRVLLCKTGGVMRFGEHFCAAEFL